MTMTLIFAPSRSVVELPMQLASAHSQWHRLHAAAQHLARSCAVHEPFGLEVLREEIAELLDADPSAIGADDDLMYWGLDSVRVMSLLNHWQLRGSTVSFVQLMAQPRLSAWVQLLGTQLGKTPPLHALPKAPPGPFALTPVQHAYWIGRGQGLLLGNVACHFYVEFLSQGLDVARFEVAVHALRQRHPMLGACFQEDGTQLLPSQWLPSPLTVHDWCDLDTTTAHQKRCELREQLSHRHADLAHGQALHFELSLLPQATVLHFDIDLLVADVSSIQIVLRDLALIMRTGAPLAPLRTTFADYMHWRGTNENSYQQVDFEKWKELALRLPPPPFLPTAQDPERIKVPRFERVCTQIDTACMDALAQHARTCGVTLPCVLMTLYAMVLARWSGSNHFVLSVPMFDRLQPVDDIKDMVADFTDLLLVEIDLRVDASFAQTCLSQQRALRQAQAHRAGSGIDVVRELRRLGRMSSGVPAVFTCAVGLGALIAPEVQAVLGRPDYMISQTPQVWLDHQVVEHEGGLLVNWDSVQGLFESGVVSSMLDTYGALLKSLADAPDWNRSVVLPLPQAQVLARRKVNEVTAALPALEWLHEGFVRQAQAHPDALALCSDTGCVSYGQLLEQVQAVAQQLRRHGVALGECVGVSLDKGVLQVAAVLGVLAVGAAYVPVGVEQPLVRRQRIYAAAGVRVVLSQMGCEHGPGVTVLPVLGHTSEEPLPVLSLKEQAQALAYVIYTSGSTGEPKGVRMGHAAALNTVLVMNQRFGLGHMDRVLGLSALDFDLSVYDIFGPLSVGAALVLPGQAQRRDVYAWQALMSRFKVSVWNSVPALLQMLLGVQVKPQAMQSLRLVLLSGDWVGLTLAAQVRSFAAQCQVVALGGATEAGIWSNAFELSADFVQTGWRSAPYGWPLANQCFRVVDAQGQDCPDWVRGELWIGGGSLAQGYHLDEQRTAVCFVQRDGKRWYRTGDVGRYRPGGCLEFLGRMDNQVKLRGHRLELGEVESVLREHQGVRGAVVQLVTQGTSQQLLAVVAVGEAEVPLAQLQAFVQARLATHAVPSQWWMVPSLPLTANGKIDRSALVSSWLAQAQVDPQSPIEDAPQGELECALAQLWCELLGVPQVGRHEHFMSLGGDSLLATRLVEDIRQRWRLALGLVDFLRNPTVMALAAHLGGLVDAGFEEGHL
jgi:amino acid adenylation domain-containing protein